jgi:hypothetical protein
MEGVLVASGMWCEIYPLMPIVERKPNGRNVDVGVPGEGTGWVTDRVLLAPWSIQDREPFLDRAISFPHHITARFRQLPCSPTGTGLVCFTRWS